MLIKNDAHPAMGDNFDERVLGAHEVRIASGYLGWRTIERYSDRFEQIVTAGGLVQIICGMGKFQGIADQQRRTLTQVHASLQAHSPASGVFFCVERRYHGKIFLTEDADKVERICSVGSSNFSDEGLNDYLEANWISSNDLMYTAALDYFNHLFDQTAPISLLNLDRRRLRAPAPVAVQTVPVPPDVLDQAASFSLLIRPEPKSNINLSESSGRLDRRRGIRTIRPYYEAEITILSEHLQPPLTDFVPDQIEKFEIQVCGDDGVLIDAVFHNKNRGDSLHDSADFQTTPREKLGEFLKGRLIERGLLLFGDPVTEEMLEEYGSNQLEFRQLEENVFHINF